MPYLTESLPLPDHTFTLLRDLIHERLGLYYELNKRQILQDKLSPLVAEHNLDSFLDYYYLLRYDENSQQEWLRVQTALAVRETYFWREVDQIQLVARQLVPELLKQYPGRVVRIWHAACASGEEPYSMTMALNEAGCFTRGAIEILGTDFDQESLKMAQRATYRERSLRALPLNLRQKYFTGQENSTFQLSDEIRSAVKFAYLNLVYQAGMVYMKDFDIIFCRNVFIYFSESIIQTVADQFYQALRNPGYLFLGAAESLLRLRTRFELREMSNCFVYRKDMA